MRYPFVTIAAWVIAFVVVGALAFFAVWATTSAVIATGKALELVLTVFEYLGAVLAG